MEEILVEAQGFDEDVELLRDKVRIKHRGFLGFRRDEREIPIAQISSVRLKKPGLGSGNIEFVLHGQEAVRAPAQASQEPVVVEFGWGHTGAFELIKRSIEQHTSAATDAAGQASGFVEGQDPPVGAPEQEIPSSPWSWNFRGRARKLAEREMTADESIEFAIVGEWWQSIVALEERLLVVKPGFMAMATFGGRTTSFYYRDINGIEINTGLLTAVIEINTPSYQGTQEKDFGQIKNPDRDPFRVSNCIPIQKVDLKRYKPYLDKVRAKVREAKRERSVSLPPQSNNLGSELERLASLRASGALTEEEFQQAKKRLLE